MQTTLLASLALSLLNTAQALPHAASYVPAPSPPFRLPHTLRSRQVSPDCDLSGALGNITIPFALANPALPAPDTAFSLASIIIGRGVQNYTCGADLATAPTALGAVATLYEASCIAASDLSNLNTLTTTALTLPLPDDPAADLDCNGQPLRRAGQHFFNSAGVPAFDFSAGGDAALGMGLMAVDTKGAAPSDAAVNVPWLLLKRAESAVEGQAIGQIYRVETRGGQPPANCDGKAEGDVVSVDYAAEYWVLSAQAAGGEEGDSEEQ